MRVISRITSTGTFVEDVLLDDGDETPQDCIESRPPDGFYWPRWDGASWVEDAPKTDTELLELSKEKKERELRDAANVWYTTNIRSFEGAIVTAKYGRSGLTGLNAEERQVFDAMNANYTKLADLVGKTRNATTVEEVEAITW